MQVTVVIDVAFRIGLAIANAVKAAMETGDVATLEALRLVCKTPEELHVINEAIIVAQRVKHTAGLRTG